tara:strand:+ start:23314 stop:23700 length:387 start_codon:yes stop_codon:yes gene_type:complete
MAYTNPQYQTYTFPAHDFGAGAAAVSFKGPLGKDGRLEDITVHATETFTNVTLPAYVRIGTASDADAYAQADLGVTAATDTFVATQDDVNAIISDALPADTQIEVAFVACTGGTPAGIGTVSITVAWI